MANKRNPEHEQIEAAFAGDIAGLAQVDAEILLRAAQRDLARRAQSDPAAEMQRKIRNMTDQELLDFKYDCYRDGSK